MNQDDLTPQQKEYQELALKFARQEMIPKAQEYDEQGTFPREIMQKAYEAGLLNTCIGEEWGGLGLSHLESVLITEALAYGCMGMNTSFMANDLALLPIVIGGSEAQKKRWLSGFTEKFQIASFCLTEPGNGSDAAGIKTTFTDRGDHWEVNGQKMWITNAGYADLYVIYGTIDPALGRKGLSALVFERRSLDATGIAQAGLLIGKKEDKMGHRASDTRAISFQKLKVPKENMLGAPGDGWKIAMKTLDSSRPLVAASAVGGSWRALDLATQYAKERHQFGKPIGEFQSVGNMLANMKMKLDASKLLTYRAASLLDRGQRNTLEASIAKAFSSDACMEITTDAVQIYGGYGYSKEYPVEKLMRDAKLIQIYEGTSQIQRIVIARELLNQ